MQIRFKGQGQSARWQDEKMSTFSAMCTH